MESAAVGNRPRVQNPPGTLANQGAPWFQLFYISRAFLRRRGFFPFYTECLRYTFILRRSMYATIMVAIIQGMMVLPILRVHACMLLRK